MAAIKYYFFDMDGTLTDSKQKASKRMEGLLQRLSRHHDVIIVSGAEYKQIKKQLPFLPNSRFHVLSQSGNVATRGWKTIWKKRLNHVHRTVISQHIRVLKSLSPVAVLNANDQVQDRGGQVSYSVLGHNADAELKKTFDPDGSIRKKMLKEWPLRSTLCQVSIGGTTCFDYTAVGWGKDGNVRSFIEKMKWNVEDCMYVGDQFYEGGNDHAMIAEMGKERCVVVQSPADTEAFITRILDSI